MPRSFKGAPATFGLPIPDIFVDAFTGFDYLNGTIRIDMASLTRSEPIPPSKAVVAVTGRIIMPPETAQRLCLALFDYLKRQGLDPNALLKVDDKESSIN